MGVAESVREAYCRVLESVPFSSVSPYYRLVGKAPDPRFGDDCHGQARALRAALEEAGIAGMYIFTEEKHRAMIVRTAEAHIFLDPYLLHSEPVVLSLEEGITADAAAYPRGYLVSATIASGELRVERQPIQDWQHKRIYSFPLDQATFHDPGDMSMCFDPRQNAITVRVHYPDRLSRIGYFLSNSPVERQHLWAQASGQAMLPFASPSFCEVVDGVAKRLHASSAELCDFVLGRARIYRELYPGRAA